MKNKLLFLLKSFVYILIKSLIATILGYIYIYIYNGFRFYESNFSYFSKGFFYGFSCFLSLNISLIFLLPINHKNYGKQIRLLIKENRKNAGGIYSFKVKSDWDYRL